MNVLICLISSRDNICEIYKKQQSKLIPSGLHGKLLSDKGSFDFVVFNPEKERIDFKKYLLRKAKSSSAILALVESRYLHLIDGIQDAIFSTQFDIGDEKINNLQNFFGNRLSQFFKNFSFSRDLMSESDNEQAMMLPIRNFVAKEMFELTKICSENNTSSDFSQKIQTCVFSLLKRKRPRRATNYKNKYFFDDTEKHFSYGHERHSRLDTGIPHVAACEINGYFRFGKRIDETRHYNVSRGEGEKTSISGSFPNCHGEICERSERTHLNMFSNDFH